MTSSFGNARKVALHRSAFSAAIVLGFAAFSITAATAQEDQPESSVSSGVEAFAGAAEPPLFDTPEAVLAAFTEALKSSGSESVAALLGLDAERLNNDEHAKDTLDQIREGAHNQLLLDGEGDRRSVLIGNKLWPLPFPIVRSDDGKWAFDTFDGLAEIVNRQVGENELQAIATIRAYVDAQEEYALTDRDNDGVREFAQKLVSSEGMTDGLYWQTDETNGASPAGDLDQSQLDEAGRGDGYFGYKYRILTGQGDNIAGGAYDYVINGNMIGGFGLIAWPAKYGETGVHTFLVNHHGVVYEADLGPATGAITKYIERFNPDDTWAVVSD